MTYQVTAITSINDIPALVASFAASLGFTTTTPTATSATVKHPTYTGARVFTAAVSNTGSAPALRERIEISTDVSGSTPAWAESPKFNRTNTNTDTCAPESPTKLHLIGMLGGSSSTPGKSFIAGVIEYGFNLYRHFYLGYIEKSTDFDGGEVITGSAFAPVSDSANNRAVPYDLANNSSVTTPVVYPFSAMNFSDATKSSNGGAYVSHANNAVPWRKFYFAGSSTATNAANLDASMVAEGADIILGGFKDGINSGYMAAGKSLYSGAQVMTPINLFIGKRVGSAQQFLAVGRPSGARMVHMEDLEPGAEVTIGSAKWRVFPVFTKSSATSVPGPTAATGSTRSFPAANTSLYVGMAYQVSD